MIVATFLIIAMVGIALLADFRLRAHDRLPMQWSLRGKVNWTAPRRVGLAFYPCLALITAIAVSIIADRFGPRPGQEREAAYAIPALVFLLLVIQCVHLLIVSKTVRSS